MDISERKRVERLKDEFVSTISHDLRTPLTAIRASLGAVASGLVGTVDPEAARLIGIADTSSQRLVRLINDVLDLQKMDSGLFHINISELDVNRVIRVAIETNRALLEEAGLSLATENQPTNLVVIGDDDRIQQVLANLMRTDPRAANHKVPAWDLPSASALFNLWVVICGVNRSLAKGPRSVFLCTPRLKVPSKRINNDLFRGIKARNPSPKR